MQIMETIKSSVFIQDLYLKESRLECLRAVYTSTFIAEPFTMAKIVRKLDACQQTVDKETHTQWSFSKSLNCYYHHYYCMYRWYVFGAHVSRCACECQKTTLLSVLTFYLYVSSEGWTQVTLGLCIKHFTHRAISLTPRWSLNQQ